MQRLFSFFFALLFLIPFAASSQGDPLCANYDFHDYNGEVQNFCAAQSSSGIIYVGNGNALLEYDGHTWREHRLPGNGLVRSALASGDSIVYAGSYGDLGYFKKTKEGLRFTSLRAQTGLKGAEFGDIWAVHKVENAIVYRSFSCLIVYRDGKVSVIKEEGETYAFSAVVGNKLLVQYRGGRLAWLENEKLSPFENAALSNITIRSLTVDDKGYWLIAAQEGFYKHDGADLIPFKTAADNYFKQSVLNRHIVLRNGNILAATIQGGLVHLTRDGNFISLISKTNGLNDNYVRDVFEGAQGEAWAALNNGIAKVSLSVPVTVFNESSGLKGEVSSVGRLGDKLYVTTSLGVFYLQKQYPVAGDTAVFYRAFVPFPQVKVMAFSLVTHRNRLFFGALDGLYSIDGSNTITKHHDAGVLFIKPSITDKDLLYVCTWTGPLLFRNDETGLSQLGAMALVKEPVEDLLEADDGSKWVSPYGANYLLRLKSDGGQVKLVKYDSLKGVPPGKYRFMSQGSYFIVTTDKGLFRYDEQKDRFVQDDVLQPVLSRHGINAALLTPVPGGAIAVAGSRRAGLLQREGSKYTFNAWPLFVIPQSDHSTVSVDGSSIVVGNLDGVFIYDPASRNAHPPVMKPVIRSVGWSGNRAGEYKGDAADAIPFKYNSFTIAFTLPDYSSPGNNEFSYLLEGKDEEWSPWIKDHKVNYNNLHEGDYTFRLKARDAFMRETGEVTFAFSVSAPWYRTGLAYMFWVILGIVLLAAIVKVNSLRLEKANARLENVITLRTHEIVHQKAIIEEKNKDIMGSIRYAKRIQEAILPPANIVSKLLPDSFILYKPKDIVSGDFYWMEQSGGKLLFAAVDCTGHGVPGAFMSIVGFNLLNQAVNEQGLSDPALILDSLNRGVSNTLHRTLDDSAIKDGMDIALCAVDKARGVVEFAGAFNPLYIIRDGSLIETKADKIPIGTLTGEEMRSFTTRHIPVQPGDAIYVFSDGYADQFGGPRGKKFKYKQLQDLLVSISSRPMSEQKEILDRTIEEWKAGYDQVDDILIMGVRV